MTRIVPFVHQHTPKVKSVVVVETPRDAPRALTVWAQVARAVHDNPLSPIRIGDQLVVARTTPRAGDRIVITKPNGTEEIRTAIGHEAEALVIVSVIR